MDQTGQRPDERNVSAFGITRDLRRLHNDGAATVAELRAFLGQMRGKSPQQVLGLVAGSSLLWSTLWATLGWMALMACLTVGPWAWHRYSPYAAEKATAASKTAAQADKGDKKSTTSGKREADQAKSPTAPGSPDHPADADNANTAAGPTATSDLQRAAKVLGIDETKVADPKTNPLDKKLDDLLDKLD
jgi:predicted lipid-binding transport protein (Tim44 family)